MNPRLKASKRYTPLLFCLLLFLLPGQIFFASARPEAQEEKNRVEEFAVEKEYDRGPVHFYYKVDKQEINIAGKIRLVLEAVTDNTFEVDFPAMEGELGGFIVRDVKRASPEVLDEKTLRLQYICVLEPFLSGEYTIPPLKLRYRETTAPEEETRLVETEAVVINVTSLLSEDREELSLQGIFEPVAPPPSSQNWIWILVTALVVCGGGTVVIVCWLRERRRRKEDIQYTPAHEIAFRQLRRLVAEEYIENEKYKLFYNGISNILRHYIENRFGWHAPESTTEEFLESVKTNSLLEEEKKGQLKDFLSHCDLVKFAELIPSSEQIQRTFDLCKNFILETGDEEVKVAEGLDAFGTQAERIKTEEKGIDHAEI